MLNLMRSALSLCFVFGLFFMFTPEADAAIYRVNDTSDTNTCVGYGFSGTCTLRGAIAGANSTGLNDTIIFDSSVAAGPFSPGSTYSLYPLGGSLSIQGSGGTLIDGSLVAEIFYVPSNVSLTLKDLDIYADGHPSSAVLDADILNYGDLTMEDVVVTGDPLVSNLFFKNMSGGTAVFRDVSLSNVGYGLRNYGDMYVYDSVVEYTKYYGLLNHADALVDGSSFSNNHGTALRNLSSLTVTYSTIDSNGISELGTWTSTGIASFEEDSYLYLANSTVSRNEGGGVHVAYNGSVAEIINTTISGNVTHGWEGGGLSVHSNSTVDLINVTIAENRAENHTIGATTHIGIGGGLYVDPYVAYPGYGPVVTVKNTIIADNYDVNGAAPDCYSTLYSADYNMIMDTTGCNFIPAGNDQVGVDPLLDYLQNDGGPTETHPLQISPVLSPAINIVPPGNCVDFSGAALGIDQRNYLRINTCDVGAYETGSRPAEEV